MKRLIIGAVFLSVSCVSSYANDAYIELLVRMALAELHCSISLPPEMTTHLVQILSESTGVPMDTIGEMIDRSAGNLSMTMNAQQLDENCVRVWNAYVKLNIR